MGRRWAAWAILAAGFAAVLTTAALGPHPATPKESSSSQYRIIAKEIAGIRRTVKRLGGCAVISHDPHTHKVTVTACPSELTHCRQRRKRHRLEDTA
jgi:polyisoprenoid-binding protein YceI